MRQNVCNNRCWHLLLQLLSFVICQLNFKWSQITTVVCILRKAIKNAILTKQKMSAKMYKKLQTHMVVAICSNCWQYIFVFCFIFLLHMQLPQQLPQQLNFKFSWEISGLMCCAAAAACLLSAGPPIRHQALQCCLSVCRLRKQLWDATNTELPKITR